MLNASSSFLLSFLYKEKHFRFSFYLILTSRKRGQFNSFGGTSSPILPDLVWLLWALGKMKK